MVTKKQVEAIIKKYQPIIHLEDWDIRANVVSQSIIIKIGGWDGKIKIFGCTFVHLENHSSYIYIWRNADKNTSNLSLEAIVVHEMLHIIFDPIFSSVNEIFKNMEQDSLKILVNTIKTIIHDQIESCIDIVARAVIESSGGTYLQNYDYRLQEAQNKTKKEKRIVTFDFDKEN